MKTIQTHNRRKELDCAIESAKTANPKNTRNALRRIRLAARKLGLKECKHDIARDSLYCTECKLSMKSLFRIYKVV